MAGVYGNKLLKEGKVKRTKMEYEFDNDREMLKPEKNKSNKKLAKEKEVREKLKYTYYKNQK